MLTFALFFVLCGAFAGSMAHSVFASLQSKHAPATTSAGGALSGAGTPESDSAPGHELGERVRSSWQGPVPVRWLGLLATVLAALGVIAAAIRLALG